MIPTDDARAIDAGIDRRLAEARRAAIRDVRYVLTLRIPTEIETTISGRVAVHLQLRSTATAGPLVLDFAGRDGDIRSVHLNGQSAVWSLRANHLIIERAERPTSSSARDGRFVAEVDFLVPAGALHRRVGLAYSLFVPARAHRAFPCFDQPDLKARFALTLHLPDGWTAVSNAAALPSRETCEDAPAPETTRVEFAETAPIPTYLFAFAAGCFSIEYCDGQVPFRVLHQDPEPDRVRAQAPEIARQHGAALDWLGDFTGRPYTYGKLDILLIQGFPFGGMEHPGAIFYESSLLILGPSASEDQRLSRAGLIAHETAHMWFGNLVTIRWFDDVWLKEVFATFFSGRIVGVWFPTVDHDLRFLLHNYPAAYDVDRTGGAHPIRQALENLEDAGALYGAIIYRKAPIVMRQLEWIVGAERFRTVIRAYVDRFAHGVAAWPDLLELFDVAGFDARDWSRAWIESAGRPILRLAEAAATDAATATGVSGGLSVQQVATQGNWPQRFEVIRVSQAGRAADVVLPSGRRAPYGTCVLGAQSRDYAAAHLGEIGDAAVRGAIWIALWDDLLEGRLAVDAYLTAAEGAIRSEPVEQIVQLLATHGARACWRLVPVAARRDRADRLERAWMDALSTARGTTRVAACFWAYQSLAVSEAGIRWLTRIVVGDESVEGLTLSERDRVTVALGIAVATERTDCLDGLATTLANPDERARVAFVRPAVSTNRRDRDGLFVALADPALRTREPWALEAVSLLNHPLRAAASIHYVEPGLALLPELQRTSDIFFPKRWCDALLHGHAGTPAVEIVRRVVERHGLPDQLRRILLQSADDLFRAARLHPEPS